MLTENYDVEEIKKCLSCPYAECTNCISRKDINEKYHIWTKEEEEYLLEHWEDGLEELAKKFNVTKKNIINKKLYEKRKRGIK